MVAEGERNWNNLRELELEQEKQNESVFYIKNLSNQ